MRLFVTGGTGFIGSHFIQQALGEGHEVIANRRSMSIPRIHLEKEPIWINTALDEVQSSDLEGCTTLVHFAAHGVSNPTTATWEECYYWNVTSALRLWFEAKKAGIKRFLICGSCFEYGQSGEIYDFIPVNAPLLPTGPYHASKASASVAALGFAIDQQVELAILRPFHVYGEGETETRFWPSLKKAALTGKDFPMTEGQQIRDFQNVIHTAADFLSALHRTIPVGEPQIYNLGSGMPMSLYDFAAHWWSVWKASGKILKGSIPHRPNETMRYVPAI